jgi:hypothetical protein
MLANGAISLSSFVPGKTKILRVTLKEFVTRVAIQVAQQSAIPFSDVKLPPQANEYMTLYVTVYGSDTIPRCDLHRSADPFLTLKLKSRKKSRVQTTVLKETRNPRWNEEFQFQIESYGTDILRLKLYDFDTIRNDVIGERSIAIRELQPGIVKTDSFQVGPSLIRLRLHLADRNQPRFVDSPFSAPVLHVGLLEAMEIPRVGKDEKSDPYAVMGMSKDVSFQKSKVIGNSSTP